MTSETIVAALATRVGETPHSPAYFSEDPENQQWVPTSWGAHHDNIAALSRGLLHRGIRHGDRVAIISINAIEWEQAQMAVFTCGAVVVGIDPHSTDEQLNELLRQTDVVAVFVDNDATYTRLTPELVRAMRFVCALRSASAKPESVLQRLSDLTAKTPTAASLPGPGPSDIAIIIFSSGTTGIPKPIAYTHRQLMLAICTIADVFPTIDTSSRMLCWLPMANLFQRMINFSALVVGATTYLLSDPRQVMDAIRVVNPDVLIGVPRFFERVHAGVQSNINSQSWLARAIARWSLRVAENAVVVGARDDHKNKGALHSIADRLVLRRMRNAFGTRIQYLVSGSAPLSERMHVFFEAIGLPIYEAYGLSENIVPVALNRPGARRRGSAGKPVALNRVRLSAENEIEVSGEGVFRGYLANDSSAQRFTTDGFWRTGDLGRMDNDGYLFIEGRATDWFKLSTGRWVSPLPIEQRLSEIAYIEQAVAIGSTHKAVATLIVLAAQQSTTTADTIAADIVTACQDFPDYQRPALAIVLNEAFTIANGALTTNLKVRRKAIESRYAQLIDRAYDTLERTQTRSTVHVEFA